MGRRTILSHVMVTAFTFVTTYLVSYNGFATAIDDHPLYVPQRQVNVTDFHLSTSLDYGIARCVGSLGMPMLGAGFVLIAVWRYFYIHAHLPSRKGAYTLFPHKRNNFSLLCVVVGSMAIVGVGAFPSVAHKGAHFFFAGIAFGNICAYMIMQVSLDKELKLYNLNRTERLLFRFRIMLSWMSALGFIGMAVSMKVLRNKAKSSAFELMMAASFMVYLGTFANQLSHVEISISANVEEEFSGGEGEGGGAGGGDHIGFLTELEINDDWDEMGEEEQEGERRSRTKTITKMSKIPTPLGRNRAQSWA